MVKVPVVPCQGLGSPGSSGAINIPDNYFFEDETARDAYFSSNPSELVEGVQIVVGTTTLQLQEYRSGSWVDITPIVRGPAGTPGADGTNGIDGVGVPTGGTTGQVLRKKSTSDYDTEWGDVGSGSGDMAKSVYDTDDDGVVNAAETAAIALALSESAIITESQVSGLTDSLSSKISHSLATAVSQFLVSSGIGAFTVKTITDVKSLLGLGSAAYREVGTTSGTVCDGDDERLSDPRTPNFTGLTEETSIADSDEFVINDVSASAVKKITKSNLFSGFSAGMDIHGLTGESGIAPTDEIPFYHISASGNRKFTFAQLVTALLSKGLTVSYSPWIQITDFTATPASTNTITTTSDLSGIIVLGMPLQYTIGGVQYTGIIDAITSSLITVCGPPLSGDITSLYYGDPARVVQIDTFIPGYFEDATNFTLFRADLGQRVPWKQSKVYIVYTAFSPDTADASSNNTANLVKSHKHMGTAQAGASSTITLSTRASSTDDEYNGLFVAIVSGTGSGQIREITDYAGLTKVATISTSWTTTPDSTSKYKLLLGDPSGSGGILTSPVTLAYPCEWVESEVSINPSMYELNWGDELEIYSGAGTGKDAQDLSGVIVAVMA